MSVSFSNFVAAAVRALRSGGNNGIGLGVNQASAPERAKSSTTLRLMAGSLSGLPQPSQRKTAMGTPQTRWREMHQSGRVAIMLEIRSSPQAGSHLTFLISSSVRVRSVSSCPCRRAWAFPWK